MRLRLVLALAATLVCGALAAADLTITFNSVAKGMMGAGGTSTEIHYYSSEFNMVRNEKDRRDTLVDFKNGISYTIDHKKKTISKMSFDDALAALESLNAAQPEGMGQMFGAMFGDPNDFKVDKVGPETVAGRSCTAWNIRVGKLAMSLSADPTLKQPIPDTTYMKMVQARAAQFAKAGPMGASFKRLYEEMAKIKGIPLKTHMTGMMGMDVATEATKIEQGPVPAATFTLPAGYKIEDAGKKMREEMMKKK
ncbi:DUF4412 domain-containing protein [Mesoterricola silvestris]|nr:DUF4412 domain-containing protein [Mesoterricola silvestris]